MLVVLSPEAPVLFEVNIMFVGLIDNIPKIKLLLKGNEPITRTKNTCVNAVLKMNLLFVCVVYIFWESLFIIQCCSLLKFHLSSKDESFSHSYHIKKYFWQIEAHQLFFENCLNNFYLLLFHNQTLINFINKSSTSIFGLVACLKAKIEVVQNS